MPAVSAELFYPLQDVRVRADHKVSAFIGEELRPAPLFAVGRGGVLRPPVDEDGERVGLRPRRAQLAPDARLVVQKTDGITFRQGMAVGAIRVIQQRQMDAVFFYDCTCAA